MKTAVEWLLEELTMASFDQQIIAINKAKEMEKQQIIEAHGNQNKKSRGVSNYTYILTGEEYYKETFNKNY
jgi:hypothetical protein